MGASYIKFPLKFALCYSSERWGLPWLFLYSKVCSIKFRSKHSIVLYCAPIVHYYTYLRVEVTSTSEQVWLEILNFGASFLRGPKEAPMGASCSDIITGPYLTLMDLILLGYMMVLY